MPIPTRPMLVSAILAACALAGGSALALGNPASANCEKHGGTVVMETGANGAQKGICTFKDGTRIDEWRYFRNTNRTTH